MNKNNTTWEGDAEMQKFCEIIDRYAFEMGAPSHLRKLSDIFKSFIHKVDQAGVERGRKTPMGVSQWKEHGKKYGYWDFFAKQEREAGRREMLEECIKDISDLERDFEAVGQKEEHLTGVRMCKTIVECKLSNPQETKDMKRLKNLGDEMDKIYNPQRDA